MLIPNTLNRRFSLFENVEEKNRRLPLHQLTRTRRNSVKEPPTFVFSTQQGRYGKRLAKLVLAVRRSRFCERKE